MAWFSRQTVNKLGLSPGTLVYPGDRPHHNPTITLTQYNPEALEIQTSERWDFIKEKMKPGLNHWIHIDGIHDIQLIETLGQHFGIHQMSLEDLVNKFHRPKMSEFEGYTHFVVKMVTINPKTKELCYDHGSIILGQNFVFTATERKTDFLRPIMDRLNKSNGRLRTFGHDYLVFALLDIVIDHFYLALSRLEESVDQMETQILHKPSDMLLSRLYEVKRETALVRKMAIPIRDFVKALNKNGNALMSEEFEVYYRDLEDHAIQIVDTCESLKETLRTLLDVSDSYSAHSQNVMFKFFTAVSAIFLPLNFLASLYGMNFHVMPGLDHPSGFFIISGLMIVVGLLVALFFKIKRWW